MESKRIQIGKIRPEITVQTARSSGPGGQHANKVETKVMLRFNVLTSRLLTDEEKETIRTKLASKLTKEGELIVSSDGKRSQLKNKEIAFKKLDRLLSKAFVQKKARKKTKPTKAANEKRLQAKKQNAEKKAMRQKF